MILVLIFQIFIFPFIKAFLRLRLLILSMSLNFIKAWRNDKYNKIVLIWRFTLVWIKMNYGQIGDQTGLFYTTNPVYYTSGNRFVHRTDTFGNLWFFHLSRRTTVIQDLLVRRQFSPVSDKRYCRALTSNTHIHDHSLYWLGRGTIDTSNTHIHDHSHYWLGRGTIDTSNTHIHDHSHYWLGRGTIDTSSITGLVEALLIPLTLLAW